MKLDQLKDVLRFLQPDNYIAATIILVLKYIFTGWLILVGLLVLRYLYNLMLLMKTKDVKMLSESVKKKLDLEEKNEALHFESVFRIYCKSKGLWRHSVLAKHIRAIYYAGIKDSKLEAGELIKHTSNRLFSMNSVIKSILSTFIIFGLLGTLIGISDTLSKLQPALSGLNTENMNAAATSALNNLLTQLGGAFAPSIFGVFYTIISVIAFALYVKLICGTLREKIEYVTLTIWIPELLPTSSQQLQNNIQLSDEQIKKSFEVAEKSAYFVENFQNETNKFTSNLNNANTLLNSMEDYTSKFNDFANTFFASVKQLTSFQGELKALYEQMSKQSKGFQKLVTESIKNSNDFQQNTVTAFEAQNSQITQILGTLKMYEEIYVKQNSQMAEANLEIIDAAKNAFEGIGHRNRELIDSISEPLVTNLSDIEKTLTVRLMDINERFNSFDTPLNQAALTIQSSFEMVDKRTESFVKELQREFIKQEQNNKEQMENLRETNSQIVKLLLMLSQNTVEQSQSSKALTELLEKLSEGNGITINNITAGKRTGFFKKIWRRFKRDKYIEVLPIKKEDQVMEEKEEKTGGAVKDVSTFKESVNAKGSEIMEEETKELTEAFDAQKD